MHVKESLIINSHMKHLVFKGGIMDVIIMGLTFPPNAPTSPNVIVVVLVTLDSFVEGFSTSSCPIVMSSSSRFSKISSSKMIALHLRWCKAKAIVGFLLELGFIFVGGTLGKIDLEKPGSNFFLNICSFGGVLLLGQSRYYMYCSK
jgi:hypothetical protein